MMKPGPLMAMIAALVLVGAAGPADAAEFRSRNPIMSPAALPVGARPVAEFRPVDRAIVEKAIRRLFAACCDDIPALDAMLSDDFVNKSRVLDNFVERFPRDSKLVFFSMQGVQTMSQHIEPGPNGGGDILVSRVSAIVRSELQFNDTEVGFSRIPGNVEYILRIEQKIR